MRVEAKQVIEQLKDLEPSRVDVGRGPTRIITQEQGEQIAAMFNGDAGLFIELDERPGQFDTEYPRSDWHWKLRQARNGCKRFFEVLNENRYQRVLRELRTDCGYDPEGDTGVDSLIGYKDALEDRMSYLIDHDAAWEAVREAVDANAKGRLSAADVVAVIWQEREKLDGPTVKPKWRPARIENGRLLEPVEGVGDVGTLVLYPEPGPHVVLVIDENSGRAQFTTRPGALGVSVDA